MNKTFLIALREFKERIKTRSFLLTAFFGPIILLILTYFLFAVGGNEKKHWNVLVMDKNEILANKLASKTDPLFAFDFFNEFLDYNQFAELNQFQNYDLAVQVNEKVLSNKQVIVYYREMPSEFVQRRLIYNIERRIEEILVKEFTDLDVSKFREIKQSLNFSFRNTYDPKNEINTKASWVGFIFGIGIILFIFMFGMTILRSVASDKSSRVVEIILASVKPNQLLIGKVIGIGLSALVQFLCWIIIIGAGLIMFQKLLFPDIFDPAIVAEQIANTSAFNNPFYNEYVELIYRNIQYSNILFFFTLYFIGGYFFYGSFFAMIGSAMGSETDGQQFILPISIILLFTIFTGYLAIYYPNNELLMYLKFIPFTSPVLMMIELARGFNSTDVWQLYFALFILFISSILLFAVAGRIYKNGILQFGHRIRLKMLFQWLKKS